MLWAGRFYCVNDKRFLSYLLKFLLNEFQLSFMFTVWGMITMMDMSMEVYFNVWGQKLIWIEYKIPKN